MTDTMGNGPNKANQTSDRIIALRLWLHRRLDTLFDDVCDPAFTGTVKLEVSGKGGRPGEPRVIREEYGVTEL